MISAAFRGLYAITPAVGEDEAAFARLRDQCQKALVGGARILQYRNPGAREDAQIAQAARLKALCAARGAIFIVNDSARVAAAVDACGAHLGQGDGDIEAARKLLGAGKIIGRTCGDKIDRMRAAFADGADYCAFGALYSSPTKPAAARCSLSILRRAADERRAAGGGKIVAIGGIDAGNAGAVVDCGAHAVAVCGAIFSAPDIEAAARALAAQIESFEYNRKK